MKAIALALLFGIVEGITEWLPISSTGHMMLLNQFLPLPVSEGFYATFLVVIQLGAIMAVIILYFHKLNPFARTKTAAERKSTWGIWLKVIVGTIPAGIIGLLFDDLLEEKVMNNPDVAYIVVSVALIVYGIVFIIMERVPKAIREKRIEEGGKHAAERPVIDDFEGLSYPRAFAIGCFQSLAVIPGTSRSGSTIIGSMLLGTSRTLAAEFAFFLAVPIMFGWSLVKLVKHGLGFTGTEWLILGVGMVSAFLMSILAIRFLIGYVKKHDFAAFGVYRIVLAAAVLLYFGLIAA